MDGTPAYPGQKILSRTKRIDSVDWWICSNTQCDNRFAKLVSTAKGERQLEILGAHGQVFIVRPEYIRLNCKKCGQENSAVSGEVPTSVWQNNLRTLFFDNEGHGEDADFLRNQYLVGLLLPLLTTTQKGFFRYMQKHPDGHWTLADAAKELAISEEEVLERMSGVHSAETQVIAQIDKKKASQLQIQNAQVRKYMGPASK